MAYQKARRITGDDMIAKSFTRKVQKKLACGAFVVCFVMAINLCTNLILLKPYLRLPTIYFHVESVKPIIFNFSTSRSDVYEINGDIRIHGISSTIFIASNENQNLSSWTIKPYAQKMASTKFKRVTDFQIKMETTDRIPHCDRTLNNIPAIVFSGRGHAQNLFHAFADVLFPLYVTSRHFNRKTIFLVTNHYSPWISKYRNVLKKLSKYDIYDIDKESEVLCFSRMIVGLKTPKGFFIHPSETTDFPIGNFRKLIRSAFSLERESVHDRSNSTGKITQPRILIISREKCRRLTNEHEIGNMARGLGFDVVVKRHFSNLSLDVKLVNSADVLLAVHGAGLTNMVFLPENATLIQITPFGLDEEAMVCYKWPAVSLKLRYLEYMVSLNESSLLGKYPNDTEVYRDPDAIRKKRYGYFRDVYLDHQDVNPDLDRFRKTLVRALELIGT